MPRRPLTQSREPFTRACWTTRERGTQPSTSPPASATTYRNRSPSIVRFLLPACLSTIASAGKGKAVGGRFVVRVSDERIDLHEFRFEVQRKPAGDILARQHCRPIDLVALARDTDVQDELPGIL